MQTISTKVLSATNHKPTRIKAVSSSGISIIVSRDKFDTLENAHRGTAFALMLKLKWHGTMISGDTKQGTVWVFFDHTSPIISNEANQVIVSISTRNDSFADSQQQLANSFRIIADSAKLEDLHSTKIYDLNGNHCGNVTVR